LISRLPHGVSRGTDFANTYKVGAFAVTGSCTDI